MSALSSLVTTVQGVGNAVTSVSQIGADLAQTGIALGLAGGAVGSNGSFWQSLRPASYRGQPFGVKMGRLQVGRRNAIHEYPYRDVVWVEDLGRQARRISFYGFIVGDDVIARRERLIAAAEQDGDGDLIHPTLGRLTVSLLDLQIEETWDKGRVFVLIFEFVEAGKRVFPALATSTGDAVASAAAAADTAAAGDFVTQAETALAKGAAVVDQAVSTAAAWARQAQRIGADATNLVHAVQDIPGSFGRYYGGRRVGFQNALQGVQGVASSIRTLTGAGVVAQRNIATAADTLNSAASGLGL